MPHTARHTDYMADEIGNARLTAGHGRTFEAGSFQSFTLIYTAGYFGIDDTGSIKVVHRFASDMGRPQWSDPQAANYTTVEASNGAVLEVQYDANATSAPGTRPCSSASSGASCARATRSPCASATATAGFARHARADVRRATFEFRVLADPFAMYNYVELPEQPFISIVAGPPVGWKAILPTSAPLSADRSVSASRARMPGAIPAIRSTASSRLRANTAGRRPSRPHFDGDAASTRQSVKGFAGRTWLIC